MTTSSRKLRAPYTRQDQTDFAHVGPSTLAGSYLRQHFWHPVYHSDRIEPGHAKPTRLLGENFTLYRGESRAPHLVAFGCAHRGMQLSPGWVEGDCIRCFYHGWNYDETGQCVEQPAEPQPFADKIKIAGYPTVEYLGLIWAYIGAKQPPPFPRYPDFEDFEGLIDVHSGPRRCNFFNNVENSLDSAHIGFVHRGLEGSPDGFADSPDIKVKETRWGIRCVTTWRSGETNVSQFGMPYMLHIKSIPKDPAILDYTEFLTLKVPVDDENHIQYLVMKYPLPPDKQRQYWVRRKAILARRTASHADLADEILAGRLRREDVDQETTEFLRVQDDVAQVGQGVIADRKNERLGRSDAGIILIRKLWARELRSFSEGQRLKRWTYQAESLATETYREDSEKAEVG